ncbi:MAG TPA: hypothetical protein VGD56_09375 [Gemmatirosa sp.]
MAAYLALATVRDRDVLASAVRALVSAVFGVPALLMLAGGLLLSAVDRSRTGTTRTGPVVCRLGAGAVLAAGAMRWVLVLRG